MASLTDDRCKARPDLIHIKEKGDDIVLPRVDAE